MNVIKTVARKLNIELGTKFNIVGLGGTYALTESGLETYGVVCEEAPEVIMLNLLIGNYEIVRNDRYRPQFGDVYWYSEIGNDATRKIWVGDTVDFSLFALGNVYRTRSEGRNSGMEGKLSRLVQSGRNLMKEAYDGD